MENGLKPAKYQGKVLIGNKDITRKNWLFFPS